MKNLRRKENLRDQQKKKENSMTKGEPLRKDLKKYTKGKN